jgi:transcriptional regulator with XRE-family HTH domain
MTAHDGQLGDQLKKWRQRRRMSQLDLALDAEISSRHLSFIETGRAMPSRNMVLRIAETLDLPLRERNSLLLAAGFAPDYAERAFDDPVLGAARAAVERIIDCHMPFPALAVDRYWNLLHANAAVQHMMVGAADHLLSPNANVLRLSLHPEGLAGRILNLSEWKAHVLHRLSQQVRASADPKLEELLDELRSYPAPASDNRHTLSDFVSPLIFSSPLGQLSFLSTTTIFGTANDVTLSEITIESFFPADAPTAERLSKYIGAAADEGHERVPPPPADFG